MAKYLTRFGIAAIREKIASLEGKRDESLRSAGEAAQNDPNAYHDNFEYEEGMRQQEMFSRQIRTLWEILQGASTAPEPADNERVAIGHYVVVQEGSGSDGQPAAVSYLLCGDGEGALFENACSVSSPLGQTLLGMSPGETRTVPLGDRSFSISVKEIRTATPADFQAAVL